MAAIHFLLNEAQEGELSIFMQKEGITSRAGFFRFLLKFYKYHQPSSQPSSVSSVSSDSTITTTHPAVAARVSKAATAPDDSHLSAKKQKLLSNPLIFDESVRQLIREMED